MRTIILTLIAATISPFTLAANCAKNPTHPDCLVPPPDLTSRVETLETAVGTLETNDSGQDLRLDAIESKDSEQDTRLDGIDTALGYLQPPGEGVGFIAVFVDATGAVVGIPNPEVQYLSSMLVKVDGYTQAFSLSIGNFNSQIGTGEITYFTDTTCGQDGGQAYIEVNPNGAYNPAVLPLGMALDGGYTAPDPTVTKAGVTAKSWIISPQTCNEDDYKFISGIPATEIGHLNIVPPLKLEFR